MTRLDDFTLMHDLITKTETMDTEATFLKELARLLDLDKDQATWLCFVFVAYYDMGSALTCFDQTRHTAIPSEHLLKLFCDTERRVHRSPHNLRRHFGDVVSIDENNGGLYKWLSRYVQNSPQQSWLNMINPLETIFGNGRWASYRTVEMVGAVCDLPVEAPDMGHAHSTGPRKGLAYLYDDLPAGNKPQDIRTLDAISNDLIQKMSTRGVVASLQDTETSLCGFKSMMNGDYYVGEDLDAMLAEILKQPNGLTEVAFQARKNVYPHNYLGELNGWTGIDKARQKIYKTTGEIATR